MRRVTAFFVGVPAFAGRQLLTLTRDLASLERSREVRLANGTSQTPRFVADMSGSS
jgi:hypothetical protein